MEADSFAEWYERRYRGMLGAVAVVTGSLDEAREATDEAFCRALAHWSRVRSMEAPEAWTYRVAVNVHRRRQRRHAMELRLLARGGTPPTVQFPDDRDIWHEVAALPPRQRATVALRFIADMTEADIAAALGVTRGTVASNLHDALRALEESLREPAHTEDAHHG
jgi:RNA polymerase sigma-70 factor (ECF subfamily)